MQSLPSLHHQLCFIEDASAELQGGRIIGTNADPGRLGLPAEECLIENWWSATHGKGTPLCPQVLSCSLSVRSPYTHL